MGIQWNLAVVLQRTVDPAIFREGAFCDHNCVAVGPDSGTRGGYTCPASTSLNPGVIGKSLPPAEAVIIWLEHVVAGLNEARDSLLGDVFVEYVRQFGLPANVAEVVSSSLRADPIELNCFGANPELWPGIVSFIATAKEMGLVVNLTTTGKRFMRDEAFGQALIAQPPNVLALSLDEVEDEARLQFLLGLSLVELKREYQKVPRDFGQAQKAVEAIHAARWAEANGLASKLLFNMVVHPGNLGSVYSFTSILASELPNVRVNPYPAQTAFLRQPGCFDAHSLALLEELVDYFIKQTVNDGPVVRRLHYWLMLKAACLIYGADSSLLSDELSGHNIWRCYGRGSKHASLAGLYVQVGQGPSSKLVQMGDSHPGGHLGCFWDEQGTVTHSGQIISSGQVSEYVLGGMQTLAGASKDACPGCAMPRLCFNGPTTESGMDPVIKVTYLELRRQHAGF